MLMHLRKNGPLNEGGLDHVATLYKTTVKVFSCLPLLGPSNPFFFTEAQTDSQQSYVHVHSPFLESRCLVIEVFIILQ